MARHPGARDHRPRARAAASLAVTLLLVLGWLTFLRPAALGGPVTYLLVSGHSMDGTLADGDLVLVRTEDSYRSGDIVGFRVPEGQPGAGSMVIHRVIGGDGQRGFRTKGDANALPDPWRPAHDDVVGSLWARVPAAGHVMRALASPVGAVAIAAVLGGWVIAGTVRDRRRGERAPAQPEPRPAAPAVGRRPAPSAAAAVPLAAALLAGWALRGVVRGRR